MSRETLQHLNTNTLIGNTDHRGTAWHYRAEHQGDEPNHYPGPIPIADVAAAPVRLDRGIAPPRGRDPGRPRDDDPPRRRREPDPLGRHRRAAGDRPLRPRSTAP